MYFPLEAVAPIETLDPVSPGLNVTKSSWKCCDVQQLFALARSYLQDCLSRGHKRDVVQGLLALRIAKSI